MVKVPGPIVRGGVSPLCAPTLSRPLCNEEMARWGSPYSSGTAMTLPFSDVHGPLRGWHLEWAEAPLSAGRGPRLSGLSLLWGMGFSPLPATGKCPRPAPPRDQRLSHHMSFLSVPLPSPGEAFARVGRGKGPTGRSEGFRLASWPRSLFG